MKIILVSFLLVILISCDSELTKSPEKNDRYNLTGKVTGWDENENLSGFIIKLTGDTLAFDTTDSFGSFEFKKLLEGNYTAHVIDSFYNGISTDIELKKDTDIEFNLKNYVSDYFPVITGNTLKYSFTYTPYGTLDASEWLYGNYTLGYLEANENSVNVREIIEGIKVSTSPSDGSRDTTFFGPDTGYTQFQLKGEWVQVKFSFFRIQSGKVEVRRYYPLNSPAELTLTNNDNFTYNFDNIRDDWNLYNLTLRAGTGPVYWSSCCESHSAPLLEMELIE